MITCVARTEDGGAIYARSGDQRVVHVRHVRMSEPQSLISQRHTCVAASLFYSDGRPLGNERILQTSSYADAARLMFGRECVTTNEEVRHNC